MLADSKEPGQKIGDYTIIKEIGRAKAGSSIHVIEMNPFCIAATDLTLWQHDDTVNVMG